MKKRILLKPIFALVDSAILIGTFLLAFWLRFQLTFLPERPVPDFELYFRFSFLVAVVGLGMLHSAGLYRLRRLSFNIEDFFAITRAVTITALIIMATNFIFRGYIADSDIETYSRLIILISWFMSLVALVLWRSGCSLFFKAYRRRGIGLRNAVIVGTDTIAHEFHRAIQSDANTEYRMLGYVAIDREVDSGISEANILGHVDDLPELAHDHSISEVVLASSRVDNGSLSRLLKICDKLGLQFSMVPGFFEILTRHMSVQEVAGIPVFQLEERIFQGWSRLVKRVMDVTISMVALILFFPLWLSIALGIRLSSKGGIFYVHDRVGKGEKVFQMIKFRSMHAGADRQRGALQKNQNSGDALLRLPQDTRVTSLGRLLRRLSLDEVPQLINVIKGDMSLVGPRPHIPSEVAHYKDWHKRKFDVMPGITGLTQVSGRKNLSLDEMIRLDILYIENWSPWLDIQILLKTLPAVVQGKGAY